MKLKQRERCNENESYVLLEFTLIQTCACGGSVYLCDCWLSRLVRLEQVKTECTKNANIPKVSAFEVRVKIFVGYLKLIADIEYKFIDIFEWNIDFLSANSKYFQSPSSFFFFFTQFNERPSKMVQCWFIITYES